jgi:hypothetical protein
MADESFFNTLSRTAKDVTGGLNTLLNGSGPQTTNDMAAGIATLRAVDVGRTAYFDVMIHGAPKALKNGLLNVQSLMPADDKTRSRLFPGTKGSDKNGAEQLDDMDISNDNISFLCHSAELPGESTATVTQKIYGVNEKFAVMTGYNDITLSFYTQGSGTEFTRQYFQEWIASITGRGETFSSPGKTPKETTYNVQYKSSYTRNIDITHYAITGDKLTEVHLYEAFPVSINQIPLNWAAQNQAMSLNVTFAYTEYSYAFSKVNGKGNYSRGPLGELLGTGIKTMAAINSISGAFKSGNPIAATSTLPNIGLSDFKVSSGLLR